MDHRKRRRSVLFACAAPTVSLCLACATDPPGNDADPGGGGAGSLPPEPASAAPEGSEPAANGGAPDAGAGPDEPVEVDVASHIQASNTGAADAFGVALAFSADGSVLAVGADGEASGAVGDPSDDSTEGAGAVYVFSDASGSWQQDAYVKASNPGELDGFGSRVALSADASTLVVGAPSEASGASGIDGDSSDDSAVDAGAVYVFVQQAGTWQQQAYVKASNADAEDRFGLALALSGDGNTLVVGAEGEDGAATGIDGPADDPSAPFAGAAYVFSRSDGAWEQSAYVKASNTDAFDQFGGAVAISADGTTLAVGACREDSAATEIDGDQADDSASAVGAVYVFVRDEASWQQQAYLKPSARNGYGNDDFGGAVSLSADGSLLAVGAAGEASAATGIDGDATDASAPYAGAVYLFGREGSRWEQLAYVKASNTGAGDEFGHHLHLAADGSALVVGAALESSSSTGIGGESNDRAPLSGAAYLFVGEGGQWREQAFIKAIHNSSGARFGFSLALSSEGNRLAVGAVDQAGGAVGSDGDPSDFTASGAGAAYVYDAPFVAR